MRYRDITILVHLKTVFQENLFGAQFGELDKCI